jgi:aminoglycoside phosphotransferase (APT) family kinase protein
VLRIVKQEIDAECDLEATREALVVPMAVSAGLRTPALLATGPRNADHRPYTIYERVEGELLGFSQEGVNSFRKALTEIGSDLAKLHRIDVGEVVRLALRCDRPDDWAILLSECTAKGLLTETDAVEIRVWQGELEAKSGATSPSRLCHNDVHAWNLIVRGDHLAAILDWGDCSWGDPAADFIGLPLRALPYLLS